MRLSPQMRLLWRLQMQVAQSWVWVLAKRAPSLYKGHSPWLASGDQGHAYGVSNGVAQRPHGALTARCEEAAPPLE